MFLDLSLSKKVCRLRRVWSLDITCFRLEHTELSALELRITFLEYLTKLLVKRSNLSANFRFQIWQHLSALKPIHTNKSS